MTEIEVLLEIHDMLQGMRFSLLVGMGCLICIAYRAVNWKE